MVVEITDEDDFLKDCARAWKVFGREPAGLPLIGRGDPELQAADPERIPEFEKKIRAQYADIFREPTGLPSARKDEG